MDVYYERSHNTPWGMITHERQIILYMPDWQPGAADRPAFRMACAIRRLKSKRASNRQKES